MKVKVNLTHPTEAWGTTVWEDGSVLHWIDGRSSVSVFQTQTGASHLVWDNPAGSVNFTGPGWKWRVFLQTILEESSNSMATSPMREMSPEEVLAHQLAMDQYYRGE